ncbi:DUF927 domain-containing protein [Providencia rettgeri]
MMKLKKKSLKDNEYELFVTLLGRTKISQGAKLSYRLMKLSYPNSEESIYTLFESAILAKESDTKKYLLKIGHTANVPKEYWTKAHQELSQDIEQYITLCHKPGYYHHRYLCVNDKVFGKGDKKADILILHPDVKKHLPVEDKQGTLKEWKKEVAPYALYSSRILLAMCCGFSGFILHLLGMEGGGFHLWGTSSYGKTSCGYIIASLAGDPQYVIVMWNNTDKGLEEIAVAHNDSFLVLDESKLLDKDTIVAAKTMQNRVYTISGGKGKTRSALYENQVAEWRESIFSTGEVSLQQLAEQGNIERLDGEGVRMIDVPADAGCDFGVFENLPLNMESANKLVDKIKQVSHLYYGSAKPKFLKCLIDDLQENEESLKANIEKNMEFFLERTGVNYRSGIQLRTAKRFAVAYAAGCLAIKYGILPSTFKKPVIVKGILKCYNDSINGVNKCGLVPNDDLLKEINTILSNQPMNLINSKGYSVEQIEEADAVISLVKGIEVIAVKKDMIHRHLKQIKQRKYALSTLTKAGILLADSGKKFSTVPIRYQNKVVGRRYCFILGMLKDIN